VDVPIYIGGLPDGDGLQARLVEFVTSAADIWGFRQLTRHKQAFLEGGHAFHGGSQWAAWSAQYAKRQEARGRGQAAWDFSKLYQTPARKIFANRNGILWDTGTLNQSLTFKTQSDSGAIVVWFGAGVPYAEYHQYGTSNMPQRKVSSVTEQDRIDLDGRVRDAVAQAVGRR